MKAPISSRRTLVMLVIALTILLLGGGYYWFGSRPSTPKYTAPMEKLSIGTTSTMSTLLWVAEQNGYFQEKGLDVTISVNDAGLFAFNELLAGKLDVAACSEFVFATQVLSGRENVRALGTIGSSRSHSVIARKDRGIVKPEDLAGKRIGLTRQTTGEFFLDLFLTFHGLDNEQVQIVNLKPQELAKALLQGQVDAVITWGVYVFNIEKQMGERVVSWPGEVYQPYYWMLITTPQFIQDKPQVLTRMFQALAQAEGFVKDQPQAAEEITARRIAMPQDYLKRFRVNEKYVLALDQRILMAMENEVRWAIRQNLSSKKVIPNYLDYLYLESLSAAKPSAIKLMTREKKAE